MQYLVAWAIDVEADTPQEAAWIALEIQAGHDPDNIEPDDAVVFVVSNQDGQTVVDLSKEVLWRL